MSAGTGAVAGGATSVLVARKIAEGGERGRIAEEARQRLLSTARLFRAHVAMERGSNFRPAMDADYLSAEERLRFAEALEAELVHVSPTLRHGVRRHIEKLCGSVDARTAQFSAPLSVAERGTNWRTLVFLEQAIGLTEDQINDHGLLGKARDSRATGNDLPAALAELDALETTLQKHPSLRAWARRPKWLRK